MLRLSGIGKSFGTKCVLSNFNLEVKPGELIFISGPSGSGKTSVLEIASGLLQPDAGHRILNTSRIGYAFQDDCLIPWLNVSDNILLVLTAAFPPELCGEKLARLLVDFNLEEAQARKPAQLSGGMKRRVNIARAFAVEPEILLLDEPFAFQDEACIEKIATMISKANCESGASVIIASHTSLPCSLNAPRLVRLSA